MSTFQFGQETDDISAPSAVLSLMHTASLWSIALYAILSPLTLSGMGWLYLGGGNELEKIHPATFLLVALVPLLIIFDQRFRLEAMQLLLDVSFQVFIIASVSTAAYAILIKQISAAPFVDTFLSTILTAAVVLAMPRRHLLQLRALLDITILVNVFLIFIEFVTQQSFALRFSTAPLYENTGPARWTGLLGLPLTAAQILGAYFLTTFIATPIRASWASISRLLFSLLALTACLLTGGRTAIVCSIGLLLLFIFLSIVRQLLSGEVNRLGLLYSVGGLVVLAIGLPLLESIGIFDTVFARFEFDNGSSLARDAVVEILGNLSNENLWFGVDPRDALALQESYGLIAIEIAWANFILNCGLIFTIPLFVGFCLFFFRFLLKYCAPSAVAIGAFTLVLTFSYNSIWSKTTVLAITVAVVVSNLRRDVPDSEAAQSLSENDQYHEH
jgi:O-antigen ligase